MDNDPRITVPSTNQEVLAWLAGAHEAAYCVLHPFMEVAPEHHGLFGPECEDGPTRQQVAELARPVSWAKVVELVGWPGIERLNRVLLEWIVAIRPRHPEEVDHLREVLAEHGLVAPEEGDFPPTLRDSFVRSFADLGYEEVLVVDEFGKVAHRHSVSSLLEARWPFFGEAHPTLYSPDHRLLYGVHWDSYFTFLCGERRTVEAIVQCYGFEGFFFAPGVQVCWYG